MKSYEEQLQPIIDEFKDGDETHLTPEEVEHLVFIIKAKINLMEGLITDKEFNDLLDKKNIR